MAVHFWPHFVVISLRTSFINKSNSGVPTTASGPKIAALRLSASIVNGTDSLVNCGWFLSCLPIVAEPVNVTTS